MYCEISSVSNVIETLADHDIHGMPLQSYDTDTHY